VKRAAHGSLKIQDAKSPPKIATWAPSHNFVGYIFTTKARIHNWNKKASIPWQDSDSAPPISGYWPTSEPNAG